MIQCTGLRIGVGVDEEQTYELSRFENVLAVGDHTCCAIEQGQCGRDTGEIMTSNVVFGKCCGMKRSSLLALSDRTPTKVFKVLVEYFIPRYFSLRPAEASLINI